MNNNRFAYKKRPAGGRGGYGSRKGGSNRDEDDQKKRLWQSRKNESQQGEDEADGGNGDGQEQERNCGSIDLNEIKASPEWERRIPPAENTPKRKYAITFGYCGTNYQGLQMNPGAVTVEAALEKALLLSGVIREDKYGDLHKLMWSRAARTDKGVHAVSQCVGARLDIPNNTVADTSLPAPGGDSAPASSSASTTSAAVAPAVNTSIGTYVAHINSFLPPDIRVHHLSKVTKTFNAKLACSGRRYHYILPTYACMHIGQIKKMFLEARRIVGDGSSAGAGASGQPVGTASSSAGSSSDDPTPADESAAVEGGVEDDDGDDSGRSKAGGDNPLLPLLRHVYESNSLGSYRMPEARLQHLRSTLKSYEGTHCYHNYTSHKAATDASSKRYIIKFSCSEPFTVDADGKCVHRTADSSGEGCEFVCLQVEGQSFLLNQIRKMVAMAVAVVRARPDDICPAAQQATNMDEKSHVVEAVRIAVPPTANANAGEGSAAQPIVTATAPESSMEAVLQRSFSPGKMDLPMAPGLGLYLAELLYEAYNKNVARENVTLMKIAEKKLQQKKKEIAAAATATAPASDAATSEPVDKEQDGNDDAGVDEHVAKRAKVDAAEASLMVPSSAESCDSAAAAPEPVTSTDSSSGDGECEGVMLNEPLEWSSRPEILEVLDKFKEEVLWNHITSTETATLSFMDYLYYTTITAPKSYVSRDVPEVKR